MIGLLVATGVLGAAILVSYGTVLTDVAPTTSLLRSPYWLGLPPSVTAVLVGFQVSAAVGFLAWLVTMCVDPPSQGILSYWNGHAAAAIVSVVLLSSLVWPFAVRCSYRRGGGTLARVVTVLSLLGAAGGALLMVAGSFEDAVRPGVTQTIRVVGSLVFATVVVLADGVGWNARFIHRGGVGVVG